MPSIEFNSLSSSLIYGTTLYHNQPGSLKSVFAVWGYAAAAIIAVVETVFTAILKGASFIRLKIAPSDDLEKLDQYAMKRLESSFFSIGWAIADLFLSGFTHTLVADEQSAREILKSGNIWWIPPGAVI